MKVEQVMMRDVKLCYTDDTLNEAARLMWDHACGCVPVVDREDRLVGVVTDRDVAMAAYTQGMPLKEIPVRTAMSQEVFSCQGGDALDVAEKSMQQHHVRRLPVVGFENRLVGIISLSDIVKEWERRKGTRSKDLSSEVIGRTLAAVARVRGRDEVVREL